MTPLLLLAAAPNLFRPGFRETRQSGVRRID